MTSAPLADQQRLLEVQTLDTRLQQIAHSRTNHPARAALTQVTEQLGVARSALDAASTVVSDLRRELAKAEQDVEQVRARAQRDQARVDSGAVSVKDVQALTSELEALARRTSDLEEVELDVMERLETAELALSEATSNHEGLTAAQAEAENTLVDALADLDAQAEQVAAERGKQAEGLDVGLVKLYDRLREQLGGLGAAPLRGKTCLGCRMELNPGDLATINSAPLDAVVRCEECGRILVRGVASE